MRRVLALALLCAAPAAAQDLPDLPPEENAAPLPPPSRKSGDRALAKLTGKMTLPNALVVYKWSELAEGTRREGDAFLWTLGRCARFRYGGQEVWLDLGSGVVKTEPALETKPNAVRGELARLLDVLLDAASDGTSDRVAGVGCVRAQDTLTHAYGKLKDAPVARRACWAQGLPLSFAVAHDKDIAPLLAVDPPLPRYRVATARVVGFGAVKEKWVRPPGESQSCARSF